MRPPYPTLAALKNHIGLKLCLSTEMIVELAVPGKVVEDW